MSLWTQGGQRRLGYILLKKIEVEIGGQIIDTHYGEWLYLWENLTSNVDNSTKLDAMTGGQQGGVISSNYILRWSPKYIIHSSSVLVLQKSWSCTSFDCSSIS
jgi:hypothetical protein